MDAKYQWPSRICGHVALPRSWDHNPGLATYYCASESYIWKATKMTLDLLYRDSYKTQQKEKALERNSN